MTILARAVVLFVLALALAGALASPRMRVFAAYGPQWSALMESSQSATPQNPGAQNPAPQNPPPTSSSPQSATPSQSAAPAGATQNKPGENKDQSKKPTNDRVFFVMPNYLTVSNEATVESLHWKQKFAITSKGIFDPYEFTTVGILAGIRQAENAYPAFGQGIEGYAKRYGTAFADQLDGNMMVGAVYPSILRTDPRYFQLGQGTFWHRVGYALSRLFVTRKDSGGHTVNLAEPVGNATAIAISNVYYPSSDRSFTSSVNGWGVQMGIDALGNELKEFWPDIHRMLEHRRHRGDPPSSAPSQ
jgi:hypothetical protein